jgi:hypothetical protein
VTATRYKDSFLNKIAGLQFGVWLDEETVHVYWNPQELPQLPRTIGWSKKSWQDNHVCSDL